MWIWCDLRSSFIPVDEKDFGVIIHPRKQYFQNIQDKIGDVQPPVGDSMGFEDGTIMGYEDGNIMGYET